MAKLSRRNRVEEKCENFLVEIMSNISRFSEKLLISLQFSFLGFWTAWWLNVSTFRKDVLTFLSGQSDQHRYGGQELGTGLSRACIG
jgi:hypothetical protein